MTSGWLAFWDKPHSIYVNARHKDVHYRQLADEFAALIPSTGARVLDYGSGEALHADRLADAADALLLCEAAPSVRAGLAARFADNRKIRVLAPDEIERQPEHSLDLILLHSVVQYLTPAETDALLRRFRRLIAASGSLVVSDVIPRDVGAASDAGALLRYAAGNGFFIAACWGLMRTLSSDYRHLRSRLGLSRYTAAEMSDMLAAAGFAAERLPRNFGHNQARLAFLARPA